ncbi:hypothetical protein HMPREF1548_01081 [Clostridium sp. KLE 1755]|nr:hypothetical protein HMPREF1548_01081 [Clostridium sp. KLE 1755]
MHARSKLRAGKQNRFPAPVCLLTEYFILWITVYRNNKYSASFFIIFLL